MIPIPIHSTAPTNERTQRHFHGEGIRTAWAKLTYDNKSHIRFVQQHGHVSRGSLEYANITSKRHLSVKSSF